MAADLGTLLVRVGITGVRAVTDGLQQIGTGAQQTGRHVSALGSIMQTAEGTFTGIMASHAVAAASRMGSSIFGVLGNAIKLSNEFENIAVGLQAITGSADTARAKLDFVKELAKPSEFTAKQLAEAGMMIEGMGLRLEKVLPLITKLTMGTRRVGEEYQRMAVGIFARIAQGTMPEREALAAFGLSRQALEEFGALFDPNGELLSDAQTTLDALARLIETRFGAALDLAASTGQAKLSALADMWEQTLARLGDAIKLMIMPIVDRLGEWLQWLQRSGWLETFAARLGAVFGKVGADALTPLDRVMAAVLAMAERLPDLLRTAAEWFGKALEHSTRSLTKLLDILEAGTLLLRIDRSIQASLPSWMFGPGWGSGMLRSKEQVVADFDREIRRREEAVARAREREGKALIQSFGAIPEQAGLGTRMRQILASFETARTGGRLTAGLPQDPRPELGWGRLLPAIAKTADAGLETARNTRTIADTLRDMRLTMFGGGPRARAAVSSIEVEIALARALGYGIG